MASSVRPYNLDPDFERAVVLLSSTRPGFFGRIGFRLQPEALGNDACISIMRACAAVYKDTGKGPANSAIVMQRLRNLVDAGAYTHDDYLLAQAFFDRMQSVTLDEEAIVTELTPLLQNRLAMQALITGTETAAKGEVDVVKVRELLDQATSVGRVDMSIGLLLGGEAFAAMQAMRDLPRLRTSIVEIDTLIGGGVTPGTLNVLIGGAGDGKSMGLAHIGSGALRQRKFVGCVTYGEVNPAYWHARVIANLTGFPINEIIAGNERVQRRVAEMQEAGEIGLFACHEMPAGSTVVELKDWSQRLQDQMKLELDLLLVDYADQMSPTKACKSEYEAMKHVYQALRELARERNRFPLWTASQAKARQKTDVGRILGLYDAADSTHKVRIADLVITLNVDKEKGEIKYFVAKHRLGKSDMLIGPLPIDFGRGRMAPIPGESELEAA